MTPQRKPVPAEALAVLRRHLAVLPPRHRERRALMASTCTLYASRGRRFTVFSARGGARVTRIGPIAAGLG